MCLVMPVAYITGLANLEPGFSYGSNVVQESTLLLTVTTDSKAESLKHGVVFVGVDIKSETLWPRLGQNRPCLQQLSLAQC